MATKPFNGALLGETLARLLTDDEAAEIAGILDSYLKLPESLRRDTVEQMRVTTALLKFITTALSRHSTIPQ